MYVACESVSKCNVCKLVPAPEIHLQTYVTPKKACANEIPDTTNLNVHASPLTPHAATLSKVLYWQLIQATCFMNTKQISGSKLKIYDRNFSHYVPTVTVHRPQSSPPQTQNKRQSNAIHFTENSTKEIKSKKNLRVTDYLQS